MKYDIKSIADLDFEALKIPDYQRPYKWTTKNVNQLINDLLQFQDCKEYRLGTLVLHGKDIVYGHQQYDIVDGQQRIVTLALLLNLHLKKINNKEYSKLSKKVNGFCKKTKFKNLHSIGYVRENLSTIKERMSDLDEKFLKFILFNCQFVVVKLSEISEAFQFLTHKIREVKIYNQTICSKPFI